MGCICPPDARDEALRPREGSHMTREQLIEALAIAIRDHFGDPKSADKGMTKSAILFQPAAVAALASIERHAVIVPIEPGKES
jgi:hypothetical protein